MKRLIDSIVHRLTRARVSLFISPAAAIVLAGVAGIDKPITPLPGPTSARLLLADLVDNAKIPELPLELNQVLRYSLEQSSASSTFDTTRPMGSLSSESALQICIRDGLPGFVSPALHRMGSGYLLIADLVLLDGDAVRVKRLNSVQAKDQTELIHAADWLGIELGLVLGQSNGSGKSAASVSSCAGCSPESLRLFAKALTLESNSDPQGGLELLEQVVRVEPRFAAAQMRLASRYRFFGLTEEALDHISRAKDHIDDLSPKDKHLVVGNYFAMRRQYSKAAEELRLFAEGFPNDWRSHFELGRLAYLQGAFAQAEREYRAAIQLNDRQAEVYLSLAMAQILNDDPAGTRRSLHRATELHARNSEIAYVEGMASLVDNDLRFALERFAAMSENSAPPMKSLAALLASQAKIYGGRFGEALADLEMGAEYDRHRNDLGAEADKRIVRAETLLLLGKSGEALAESRKIPFLQRDPIRMVSLGLLWARLGNLEDARKVLANLERTTDPPAPEMDIELLRGEIRLASGRQREAIESFARAKRLSNPETPLEPLARALASAGLWERAAREYDDFCGKKAVALFPPARAWFSGRWVRALFDAANTFRQLNNRAGAQQYYRQYLWVLEGADGGQNSIQSARALLIQGVRP